MEKLLIVSSSEKITAALTDLLKAEICHEIISAKSGSEARRMFIDNDFDAVIINAPLSDEFGDELASELTGTSVAGIVLIVKNEMADEVSAKVISCGVMVVPKPINKAFFYGSLKLIAASRVRLAGLRRENFKLQTKIDEIKLIDRAKCALIQYLGMTESSAHRYIEKQAMDMRTSRKQVAEDILNTYEV